MPGSHKLDIPPARGTPAPREFASHDWITGVSMEPGDLLVFPEALMHGAYPWQHEWERRCLIGKVYPSHLANLHARPRGADARFWL